jgi:hypothetical protein
MRGTALTECLEATTRRWRELSAFREFEVNYLGCGDGFHELEPVQIVGKPVEKPLSAPQQRRRETDFHLVDESRREVLLRGFRSARERYVFAARGAARLFERGFDSVRDKREASSTLENQGLARMVCEYENRMMVWRIFPPPAVPRLLA